MKIDEYIPEIVSNERGDLFAKSLIPLTACSICGNKMLRFRSYYYRKFEAMYPAWYKANLRSQLKRAGIKIPSEVKDKDDELICEECAEAGLATFTCAMCEEERSSVLKKVSFGIDPPEYLCTVCYGSVTAKEWDDKYRELQKTHQYDWE